MPRVAHNHHRHSRIVDRAGLRRALLAWYRRAARDLPWRRNADPYRVWLSEIMLQQTRVETVIPYFQRFLDAFATAADLAAADEQEVLRLWAGLGYYSRARNLHAAAQRVANEFGGEFPVTATELQQLPGIGRYTAAAIASICHNEPVAVLDGNVKRVIARLLAIKAPINDRETTEALWQRAESLLDPRHPGDFNQAMMELGATVCIPRTPRCADCPLRRQCRAHVLGIAATLPQITRKPASPTVHRIAVAIRNDFDEVLVVRRSERGLLRGMWTLPGAELETRNRRPPIGAAVLAEVGLRVVLGERLGIVEHVFTHRKWIVAVHAGTLLERIFPPDASAQVWVNPDHDSKVPLSTVDRKMLAVVAQVAATTPRTQPAQRRKPRRSIVLRLR